MAYSKEYDLIRSHPYTQSLIASGQFSLEHPYDLAEDRKSYSLTAGTLSGPNMIAHTPVVLIRKPESSSLALDTDKNELPPAVAADYIVIYHLGSKLCGHQGIIHGGLLATLLDESLCRAGFPLLPNKLGVTASLNIKYLAPTPADGIAVLHAWPTKLEGRKVTIQGTLSSLSADAGSAEEATAESAASTDLSEIDKAHKLTKTAWAEALVIEPRWVAKLQTGHFTESQPQANGGEKHPEPQPQA